MDLKKTLLVTNPFAWVVGAGVFTVVVVKNLTVGVGNDLLELWRGI